MKLKLKFSVCIHVSSQASGFSKKLNILNVFSFIKLILRLLLKNRPLAEISGEQPLNRKSTKPKNHSIQKNAFSRKLSRTHNKKSFHSLYNCSPENYRYLGSRMPVGVRRRFAVKTGSSFRIRTIKSVACHVIEYPDSRKNIRSRIVEK